MFIALADNSSALVMVQQAIERAATAPATYLYPAQQQLLLRPRLQEAGVDDGGGGADALLRRQHQRQQRPRRAVGAAAQRQRRPRAPRRRVQLPRLRLPAIRICGLVVTLWVNSSVTSHLQDAVCGDVSGRRWGPIVLG